MSKIPLASFVVILCVLSQLQNVQCFQTNNSRLYSTRTAASFYTRKKLENRQYAPLEASSLFTKRRISIALSSMDDDSSETIAPEENESQSGNEKKLDRLLSKLTSAFPLFVSASAVLALIKPATLTWVNQGNQISAMLAAVMVGTGLTLEFKDFSDVFKDNFKAVPLGVLCQFIIMPLTAWLVGKTFLYPVSATVAASTAGNVAAAAAAAASTPIGPELFLGLCLVGCSPGGTASNLVTLISGADVALSVILTACSTMMAVFMTPLLVKLLVGQTAIQISGLSLCLATAKVVLLPVLIGMILNSKAPKFSRLVSRFTPFASVLLVSIICGGVVSQNTSILGSMSSSANNLNLLPTIILSVLLLHSIGFAAGYLVPRFGFQQSEKSSRTISIEVGMQNSALAVVLARSVGAHPLASLPGALSATAHSCLGSMLAAFWRTRNPSTAADKKKTDEDMNTQYGRKKFEPDDPEPEFSI